MIGVLSPMFQNNTGGCSSSCHGDLGVKIKVSMEMDLYYTPGKGKIVPCNVITLLVGEKLCRVI